MAVSTGNIGFNEITQELYSRTPQVGDNLLQMFADAPANGFDPVYDIGNAGPGDAMSEFKAFTKAGIFGGSWESYRGTWYNYTPDKIYQKYFSTGDLRFQVKLWPLKTLTKTGELDLTTQPLDTPITATLKLGGVTILTKDVSTGTTDFITFNVSAISAIPSGTYNTSTDIVITLRDASGYIVNASVSSTYTYLHIYDKDTSAYRWQWSTSATDSYPIVYPVATYKITTPLTGTVPGSSSPAINVKILDEAGFTDIKAFVSLQFKAKEIGNDTDGWVALGSAFVLNVDKKLIFDVTTIVDYMKAGNNIAGIQFLPRIKLTFGGGSFSTSAFLDSSVSVSFFKVLLQSIDSNFTWEWDTPLPDPTIADPTLDDTTGDPPPIDPVTGGGGGKTPIEGGITLDDTIIQ